METPKTSPERDDWTAGLPDSTVMRIWDACAAPRARIKNDALCCVSRHAIHYGLGGEIHDLTMQVVGLKVGLRLGFIRAAAA